MEPLFHLFVWVASPAAVGLTAVYALKKDEFFLGAFASASMLLLCAAIAIWMFDGRLLSYQFIYSALLAIPALMFLVAAIRATARGVRFIVHKFRSAGAN